MVVHVAWAGDGFEPIGFTGDIGFENGIGAGGFVGIVGVGSGAGHGDFVGHEFYTGVTIVGEFGFARSTTFGCDEDDSVGRAHTVNGCGGGVFEDIH